MCIDTKILKSLPDNTKILLVEQLLERGMSEEDEAVLIIELMSSLISTGYTIDIVKKPVTVSSEGEIAYELNPDGSITI